MSNDNTDLTEESVDTEVVESSRDIDNKMSFDYKDVLEAIKNEEGQTGTVKMYLLTTAVMLIGDDLTLGNLRVMRLAAVIIEAIILTIVASMIGMPLLFIVLIYYVALEGLLKKTSLVKMLFRLENIVEDVDGNNNLFVPHIRLISRSVIKSLAVALLIGGLMSNILLGVGFVILYLISFRVSNVARMPHDIVTGTYVTSTHDELVLEVSDTNRVFNIAAIMIMNIFMDKDKQLDEDGLDRIKKLRIEKVPRRNKSKGDSKQPKARSQNYYGEVEEPLAEQEPPKKQRASTAEPSSSDTGDKPSRRRPSDFINNKGDKSKDDIDELY